MYRKDIQDKLKIFFAHQKEVLFVYLFGSMVTGKIGFDSDVDLALYLENGNIGDLFKKRLFLIEKIQTILKRPSEVIILNEAKSIFFNFVIVKEGKVIFERDHGRRVDFEFKVMDEYYDFRPFIEEYNKAYLERSLGS